MPPKTVPTAAEKLETKVYGTQEQQDRKEKVQGQIDSFDKAMDGREYALQGKEIVGDLNAIRKTPINKLSKAGGLFKSGPEANFGEIRSLVQFALAVSLPRLGATVLTIFIFHMRCDLPSCLIARKSNNYNKRLMVLSSEPQKRNIKSLSTNARFTSAVL
jgi:hypothetical protein